MAEEVKDSAVEEATASQTPDVETKTEQQVPELDDLRRQIEEAKAETKAAREGEAAARREAEAGKSEATRFRSEAERAQFHGIERAIEGADAKLAQLKTDLATAYATSDFAKIADLQIEVSRIAARKTAMEDGRDALKARLDAAAKQPAPQQQAGGDPVEAVARTLSPRSAAWVRAHPEAVRNKASFDKLSAIAQYATNVRGLEAESDAFFQYIEQEMGYRQQTSAAQQRQPSYSRRANASLPPARMASSPINGKPAITAADIPDSAALLEAARTAGITPAQYKEQYIRLVQDGDISDVLGVMH